MALRGLRGLVGLFGAWRRGGGQCYWHLHLASTELAQCETITTTGPARQRQQRSKGGPFLAELRSADSANIVLFFKFGSLNLLRVDLWQLVLLWAEKIAQPEFILEHKTYWVRSGEGFVGLGQHLIRIFRVVSILNQISLMLLFLES